MSGAAHCVPIQYNNTDTPPYVHTNSGSYFYESVLNGAFVDRYCLFRSHPIAGRPVEQR